MDRPRTGILIWSKLSTRHQLNQLCTWKGLSQAQVLELLVTAEIARHRGARRQWAKAASLPPTAKPRRARALPRRNITNNNS